MRREIFQEIEVPEGVNVKIEDNTIFVSGKMGENTKKFRSSKVEFKVSNGKVFIGNKGATKKEKKIINTYAAHLRNMIRGSSEGFEYILKSVYSHFPITVEIHGNEAIIKNFLGEKIPRKSKILDGVKVSIKNDVITVSSASKESSGQTAANFENSTKVGKRDRRVFQDGIFITNKAGEEI